MQRAQRRKVFTRNVRMGWRYVQGSAATGAQKVIRRKKLARSRVKVPTVDKMRLSCFIRARYSISRQVALLIRYLATSSPAPTMMDQSRCKLDTFLYTRARIPGTINTVFQYEIERLDYTTFFRRIRLTYTLTALLVVGSHPQQFDSTHCPCFCSWLA